MNGYDRIFVRHFEHFIEVGYKYSRQKLEVKQDNMTKC